MYGGLALISATAAAAASEQFWYWREQEQRELGTNHSGKYESSGAPQHCVIASTGSSSSYAGLGAAAGAGVFHSCWYWREQEQRELGVNQVDMIAGGCCSIWTIAGTGSSCSSL